MKFKAEQQELYNTIDYILWKDWDPIGSVPRNEYKNYTERIFKLKTNGSNEGEIAKRLLKYETKLIGLPGNAKKCLAVAKKIAAL